MMSRFSTDELSSDLRIHPRVVRSSRGRAKALTAHNAIWLDMLYVLLVCTGLAAVIFGLLTR